MRGETTKDGHEVGYSGLFALLPANIGPHTIRVAPYQLPLANSNGSRKPAKMKMNSH